MHYVFLVPVYDMHGHLIKPIQYRNQLEGAVIELHFKLRHWSIGGKDSEPNSDTYIADVTQIHVLVHPIVFRRCNPRVEFSHTVPMPPNTVPVPNPWLFFIKII